MKGKTLTEAYQRYAALIQNSVLAQTQDRELAQEICQQTFLAYYQNIDRVDPRRLKSWLMHTAKNRLIDYWRRASTRKEIHDLSRERESAICDESRSMEQRITDREFISFLMDELKRENESWYEAVDHICIQGMDYEETAKHLGISSGVLRTRIYRARKFFQEHFGKEYLED